MGANYQARLTVFGVEADGDWADASGFGTFTAYDSVREAA